MLYIVFTIDISYNERSNFKIIIHFIFWYLLFYIKADPGQFWSYFFSALCMILLLLIIKARRGGHDSSDQIEVNMLLLSSMLFSVLHMLPRRNLMSDKNTHASHNTANQSVILTVIKQTSILPAYLHVPNILGETQLYFCIIRSWLLSHEWD